MFINLKDYADRREPSLASDAIANKLREEFGRQVPDAAVAVFPPSPVRGVGRAGGFALMIEDRGDFGPGMLQSQTENLVRKGLSVKKVSETSSGRESEKVPDPFFAGMFT